MRRGRSSGREEQLTFKDARRVVLAMGEFVVPPDRTARPSMTNIPEPSYFKFSNVAKGDGSYEITGSLTDDARAALATAVGDRGEEVRYEMLFDAAERRWKAEGRPATSIVLHPADFV
jgi:hypothetical protein